ncbi:TIGR03086 family metal-binding protein [Pseudonocardia sp. GCM10023141]|uniref:TIGR03086 family metal-binding protein n=1 Tax=Pseudonocardia sp. GCM10023141 TaxID=3252653 RepID=UPI00361AE275
MSFTTRSPAALVGPAAAPILALTTDLDPALLDRATPCTDFDVRTLLGHIAQWAPVFVAAASKDTATPGAADAALAPDLLARAATAWSDPAAWDGTASFGADPLPASMIGGMIVGEFVVHGWDLGRALGVELSWPADVLTYLHAEVAGTAELARQMSVYGPEVPVPATAPALDRLLGASGRDPRWSAS